MIKRRQINSNTHQKLDLIRKTQTQLVKTGFSIVTEEKDKSLSQNEQINKNNIKKLKVQRKDSRQTQPQSIRIKIRNQKMTKQQPITQMIQKSPLDPFLRRKLEAQIKNDIKSLKKLKDHKINHVASSSFNISMNEDQSYVTQSDHFNDSQLTRTPNNIGKIMSSQSSKRKNFALKKMKSQSYLIGFIPYEFQPNFSISENQETMKPQQNFTTFRNVTYKEKFEGLEKLKQFHQKQHHVREILNHTLGFGSQFSINKK